MKQRNLLILAMIFVIAGFIGCSMEQSGEVLPLNESVEELSQEGLSRGGTSSGINPKSVYITATQPGYTISYTVYVCYNDSEEYFTAYKGTAKYYDGSGHNLYGVYKSFTSVEYANGDDLNDSSKYRVNYR